MESENTIHRFQFPVYRKYSNEKSYFKIISDHEFYQLELIGNGFTYEHLIARLFPDKLLIQDMKKKSGNYWMDISSEEFENKLQSCRDQLPEINLH